MTDIETAHLREKLNEYTGLLETAVELLTSPACDVFGNNENSKQKLLSFLEAMEKEKIGSDVITTLINVIKGA